MLAVLGGGTLVTVSASAQGVFDPGVLTVTLGADAVRQSEESRATEGSVGGFNSILRTPRSSGAAINPARLTFRPSPAVRRQNQQRFIAKLARADRQGAADLQRAFTQRDLMGAADRLTRQLGLNPHSVADATAIYLVTAWYGVRGSTDSKPADFKAVSRQLARTMPGNATFANASDAVKQEVAESMLVQASLADEAVTAARKQPSAMPSIRNAIGKGARSTFGFDLTRMRLGPNGLE